MCRAERNKKKRGSRAPLKHPWRPRKAARGDNHYDNRNAVDGSFLTLEARMVPRCRYVSRETHQAAEATQEHRPATIHAGERIGDAGNPGPVLGGSEEPPSDFFDACISEAASTASGPEAQAGDAQSKSAGQNSPRDREHLAGNTSSAESLIEDEQQQQRQQQRQQQPDSEQSGKALPPTQHHDLGTTGIIRPWNWFLSKAQSCAWTQAEATAKCTFKKEAAGDPTQPPGGRRRKRGGEPAKEEPTPAGDYTAASSCRGTYAGYVFKTGNKGTGYYADHGTAAAETETDRGKTPEKQEPADLEADDQPYGRTSRARRRRDGKGGRLKRPNRLTRLLAAVAAPILLAIGHLPDKEWKQAGLWAIDTGNCNCADTALDKVLNKSAADVTCLQEVRHKTKQAAEAYKRKLRGAGWSAHISLAKTTAADRGSGGCAVAARRGIGIAAADEGLVDAAFQHRIAVAHVSAVVTGGIHVISVYLKDSEGLSEYNLRVLQEVAALARTLGGPWVIAGDWNVHPSKIQESNWLKVVKGTVATTCLSTCHDNTYDYFVVSHCLAHAVAGVQRMDDVGLHPHAPCRLLLRGDARRHAVRKLHRAPKVPATLPHGPAPRPPSYQGVVDKCTSKNGIAVAMREWYRKARKEWAALTEAKMDYQRLGFKWGCQVGNACGSNTTALAAAWAEAAKRAEDMARLRRLADVGQLAKPQQEALDGHRAALKKLVSKLPTGVPPELKQKLGSWAEHHLRAVDSDSRRSAQSLMKLAGKKAKEIESQVRVQKMQEWRNAIGATASGPAARAPTRLAYRWLKGLTGWEKSPLGTEAANDAIPEEPNEYDDLPELPKEAGPDGEYSGASSVQTFRGSSRLTPMCDQAVVEAEADKWGTLWNEGKRQPKLEWGTIDELPPLTVDAIRAAARSFPAGTGLGVDNISPRALLRLSDEAIAALAELLMTIERSGEWPPELNLVLIVLLAKSDGGFRPIGLFPTVIRVWMRARTAQARAWEARNHSRDVYGGKGMGAQRAAWVEAFNAEAAGLEKEEQAQALLDLTKAFELVDHKLLVDAAKKRGYPLALLRLSLAAYRLSRTVGIDGCYSREIAAQRGITTGSGFATTELRLLLMDVLETTFNEHGPTVRLTLYVDDLTVSVRGAAKAVAKKLAAAVDTVVAVFQDTLDLKVSVSKSTVVASSRRLAARVCRKSKAKILSHSTQAKLLGTAASGGRRRSTKIAKERLGKFRTCVGRMWQLRKLGVNTKQMTRAAGTSSIMYGCDIQGVSNSLLAQQTSTIARAAAPPGAGKNPHAVLHVLDGPSGTMDPSFDGHALLVKHLASAWWEDWIPTASLTKAYEAARDKQGGKKLSWNAAAGPTAALWMTLERAKWKWKQAHLLEDDLGNDWDTRKDPPVSIAAAMADSVRRMRHREVAKLHPALVPARPDTGASNAGEQDVVIEFSGILGPMASGKVASVKGVPEFSRKHASALLSASAGGQWPQAKKAAVKKWGITDDLCQLCREAKGTLEHRLVCRCNTPVGGWSQRPAAADLAAHTIGEARLKVLRTTGLLALKVPGLGSRRYDTFQWGLEPSDDLPCDVTWFIDGSRLNPRRKLLATCGFAVAAVARNGDLCAWGWGVPPKWCDSAAAAEAWALSTVLRISPSPHKIITDCLGLKDTAALGVHAATTTKMHLARTWAGIAESLDGDLEQLIRSNILVWMPAHRTANDIGNALKSNASPVTAKEWRANRLVDGLAKLAAAQGTAPKATVRLIDSAEALVRHSAAQLAVATYNANHHQVHKVKEDGTVVGFTIRDSQEAPHSTKSKGMKPLSSKATVPKAAVPEGEPLGAQGEGSSSSAEHLTRKQEKRRARKLVRAALKQQQDYSYNSVVLAPRRNHQEAVVDTARRQQLAKTLRDSTSAASKETDLWGSFLSLETSALTEKEIEVPHPRASGSAAGTSHAACQQSITPRSNSCTDSFSILETTTAARGSGAAHRTSRQRPTKGGNKWTEASSRASVASLVGISNSGRGPPA